jgi:hypothetical protein
MKKPIKEYGGKEKYASMAAKKKHEAKETKAMEKKEKGSPMKKMKDLSGDGKVTKKDVLIGRGVIKASSPAKKYKK